MRKWLIFGVCVMLILTFAGCVKPEADGGEASLPESSTEELSGEESEERGGVEYCEVIKGHTVRFTFPDTFTDVEVRFEADLQRFAFVHIPSKEAGGELLYFMLLTESEIDPAFVSLGEVGEYHYGYVTAMDVRFLPETEDVFRERLGEIKTFVTAITVE